MTLTLADPGSECLGEVRKDCTGRVFGECHQPLGQCVLSMSTLRRSQCKQREGWNCSADTRRPLFRVSRRSKEGVHWPSFWRVHQPLGQCVLSMSALLVVPGAAVSFEPSHGSSNTTIGHSSKLYPRNRSMAVCVSIYMYIYIYIYVCVCVSIYSYI